MKFVYIILLLLSVQFVICQESNAFKVVLDAGHGGEDPGAINKKLNIFEKNIALDVCLKVEAILSKTDGIEVYLTRKTDVFIPVFQRAEIANKKKANLFLSVHLNSTTTPIPYGTETFVMGLSKSKSNLEVAKKENSVITLEKDYKSKYEGFDPNSPESLIGLTLLQEQYLDQSVNLASKLQKEYTMKLERYNRGVKQDVFLVLHKASMPSVLTELGFISNDSEATYMNSEEGKQKLAQAIANAILDFKNDFFNSNVSETNNKNKNKLDILLVDEPILKNDEKKEEVKVIPEKSEIKETKIEVVTNKKEVTKPKDEKIKSTIKKEEIIFKVQIKSSVEQLKKNDESFKGHKNVTEFEENKVFKYYYFESKSYTEAKKHLTEAKNKGFTDAFIVGFVNDKRVNIDSYKKN